MVPGRGVEPLSPCGQRILSLQGHRIGLIVSPETLGVYATPAVASAFLAEIALQASAEHFHREHWVYEEKYDGWRIAAVKDGREIRLDLTPRARSRRAFLTLPSSRTTVALALDEVGQVGEPYPNFPARSARTV